MASRTTTDPIEILLEMGVDLDNLSEEEDYLSALMEAVNTLTIKDAKDPLITPLQQELLKVRKKRFKKARPEVKKTTIKPDAFFERKSEKETPRKTLENKLGKDVVSKLSDDQIKKLSEYYNSLPPKERKKVDSEIANKRGEFFDIARGMAGIKFVELNENEKQKFTPDAVEVEQGPILPPKEEGGDVYSERKVKLNSNNLESPIKEKSKLLPASTKITESPIKEKRKMLPGATKKEGPSQTKGGALVKSDSDITDIVNTQGKLLSNLAKTLNADSKQEKILQKKKQRLIAKKEDKNKKQKKETNIEKKNGLSGITKLADKLLAPVKNLFGGIFDYIKLTALNFVVGAVYKWFTDPANEKKVEKIKNFFISIGGWFQDPKNQEKLSTIGRFLKDNWKVILGIGGVILLWNSGIGAVVTAIGLAVKGIGVTLLLLAKNPLIAAAIGIGAGLTYLSNQQSKPDSDVDESVEKVGKEQTLSALKEQQDNRSGFQKMGDFITGAGSEREEQIYRLETGEEKRYNKGGLVPVNLTKGEYVVAPEQVQKIGVNKLKSINNIGNYNRGGNVSTNTDEFNLGGLVPGRGPNVDTVRTVLPEGSYVIQRPSVDALGAENIPGMIANLGGLGGGGRGGTRYPGGTSGQGSLNRQQGQSNAKGNPLLDLFGATPTGMAFKGAASLGKGAMSFGSSIKEKGLGNATMDAAGGLFGNIKGVMDEKGITDAIMMNPLVKMGAFGLRKGKEAFGLPPDAPGMGGGGGGTNALTSQAKVRTLGQILSDPTGSKLRKRQFNDPQNYLTDEEFKNRGQFPGKKPRRRENRRSYNSGGSIRNFLTSNQVNNSQSYNSGGSIKNFLTSNLTSNQVNNSQSYNSGGSIRNFLALNRGGRVDNPKSQEGRGKAKKTGRSGGTTKVEKTDGGSAIVAAAKNAVSTGRRGPASPPCASWVRMVLGMANHPVANQTTTTADLDPQIGPDSGWATSLNSAASFAGSDLGTVVRNSGSLKPGDIILHKNTYGNYGPGAITHVSIASDKKGKMLHQSTSGGAPTEQNIFSFAHGLRLGGEGTIGEYSNDDPGAQGSQGSSTGDTGGQSMGGALGSLMQMIGLDPRSSLGTPIKNSKVSVISNTSPSDIDSEEEKSSVAVNSLPSDSETIDKRSGSKDSDRVSSTVVRTGLSSINLYNWQYDKIYGIVGA